MLNAIAARHCCGNQLELNNICVIVVLKKIKTVRSKRKKYIVRLMIVASNLGRAQEAQGMVKIIPALTTRPEQFQRIQIKTVQQS